MSYHAVEWVVYTPLSRITLARVILRVVDGFEYYVALRDIDGEGRMLGSWDSLAAATGSVIAMYHQDTGETIYGDPEVDRYLKIHEQTPLPGAPAAKTPRADPSRQAAMPPLRAKRAQA